MSTPSRGGAVSILKRGLPSIRSQYSPRWRRLPISHRPYSAAAAVAESPHSSLDAESADTELPRAYHPPASYKIKSAIILTRPPLLTREHTAFESAFFLYQKRLNERLSAPFRPELYFRADTPSALDWKLKKRYRSGVAGKDIGLYSGGQDDEVEPGSRLGDAEDIRAALLHDAETRISEDGERIPYAERVPAEQPMPRKSEADEKGDLQRLDREMDRTLYFVVEGKEGAWAFPCADVHTSENLHETAARALESAAGVNMNTWIVGRTPVAHHVAPSVHGGDGSVEQKGEKIFFLKGRIMAGQADLSDNSLSLKDFKWLTKDELRKELPEEYFHSVKGMMDER